MELAEIAQSRVAGPLHRQFAPAVLANHAYLGRVHDSGRSEPLVIGLERHDGAFSVFKTHCFGEGAATSAFNLSYAERLVKMLLWQRGGWRVVVGGPRSIGEHIRQVYSPLGARAFDVAFMAGAYAQPFVVEITDAASVPESSEKSVPLGGHLEGCRIGFDLGATDRKVAAVMDGQVVFTEEVLWDPRSATDPAYHFNEINTALHTAAKHLPRVDAIGGSAAGVYINNQPRVGSLYRGVAKELSDTKIRSLFADLKTAWGGIPIEVVNDGEVTALAGAMSLQDNAVLGMALGSSEAGGYVTALGEITSWLNELAFCPVDFHLAGPADEWSGDTGCGAQYFSQQAVFRLAPEAGIHFDPSLGAAEKLKYVQHLLHSGDPRAQRFLRRLAAMLVTALLTTRITTTCAMC